MRQPHLMGRGKMPGIIGHATGAVNIISIVPASGPAGLFGPSVEAVTDFAVAEINAGGGVLGRELRVRTIARQAKPAVVAAEISALIVNGNAHAVTGFDIAPVRAAVAASCAGRVPCLFAIGAEGMESMPLSSSEQCDQQIAPALDWSYRRIGACRWAIIGNDYGWPQQTAQLLRRTLPSHHTIVAEHFLSWGTTDFLQVLADPQVAAADGIVVLLIGMDAARFNRAFAATGRDRRQVRISSVFDENVLLAAGPESNRNTFVSSTRFVTGNRSRVEHYRRLHGGFAPVFSRFGNAAYHVVNELSHAVELAGAINGLDNRKRTRAPEILSIAQVDGVEFTTVDTLEPLVPPTRSRE